jgi:hypothetical protein
MACRPLNYEEGKVILVPATNSETFTKGQMLTYSSGLVTAAAGGQGTDVELISASGVLTTVSGQLIPCWPTRGVLYECDTDAVWSTADQGTYCDLAAATTLDPDATADDLFFIIKGIGTAETDTKVLGFFQHGVPNS